MTDGRVSDYRSSSTTQKQQEIAMVSFGSVKRFLEEAQFVRVTDFAKYLKRRHKNGKLRDTRGKKNK